MTRLNYNHPALFFFCFAGMLALMVLCLMPFSADAQEVVAEKTSHEAENPIHITADSLITDPQGKTAEFIGHVLAIQGDTTITSNRLMVYYTEGLQSLSTSGTGAIVRIVAQGMVKIVTKDQIAHTEHAEYITDKRIVILTGSNSRIVNGNDSISGHKITLYREDGRIHVAGTEKEPVEAIFYSDKNVFGVPKKKN